MRRNGYSRAFKSFELGLERPRKLRSLDVTLFNDPPPPDQQQAVEALRGGAIVLMVATLERYLKDALQEYIELIAVKAVKTNHPGLDVSLAIQNDFGFLNWLMRESRLKKPDKIIELRRVVRLLATEEFLPESFNRTRANPGPETVTELIRNFGVADPFNPIESIFVRHYKKPFARGFLRGWLETLVIRRNEVAHEGYALGIARDDLRDWIEILHAFAKSVDNVLRDQTFVVLAKL